MPVAAPRAIGLGALGQGRAAPGGPRRARDDVDHPTQRLRAVEHRHRPANDLDAFDVLGRNPITLEIGVTHHAIAGSDALAIDQDQRVAAVHAAQADHLAPRDRPALHGDADLAAQGIEHVVGTAIFNLRPGDHRHRCRRIDQGHRVARRGDDHGLRPGRVGHHGPSGRETGPDHEPQASHGSQAHGGFFSVGFHASRMRALTPSGLDLVWLFAQGQRSTRDRLEPA